MRALLILLVVLLFGGVSQPLQAQDAPSPEALQAANELVDTMSSDMEDQLMTQMMNSVWPRVEQELRASKIDNATIAEIHKELDRIEFAFVADGMKGIPAIYARHFTVAELHEMGAFYHSPTGVKALREMPQVMGEFMKELFPQMMEVNQQISEAVTKILRDHGYSK
jgi:uncharacterized protein